MFILTGNKCIINCDNVIDIKVIPNNNLKYNVEANPGGTIITVNTLEEAAVCVDFIYDKLVSNARSVSFRDMMEVLLSWNSDHTKQT